LTHRWIVSNVYFNPTIPPEAFSYRPTAADSLTSASVGEPGQAE
jgi:hypothetical protein